MTIMEKDVKQTKRFGHAAYCDTCDRFDEGMRRRGNVPFCSFCETALPDWPPKEVPVSQQPSAFIVDLTASVTARRALKGIA